MARHTPKTGEPPDESDLFRRTIGKVTPLRTPPRAVSGLPRPDPLPLQTWLDEQAALRESLDATVRDADVETGEELSFVRPGIGTQTLVKLRRGHWVIQDELDLHGLNVPDAHELLVGFLALCGRRGVRCVRVIHGKGLRSRNRQPVLKQKVANWLMRRDEILAFCQARPVDGGGGAVVVLLKGKTRNQ